jgi:phage shock protein E
MRKLLIAAAQAALALASSLAAPRIASLPPMIGEQALKALLEDRASGVLLLDVRTLEEFEAGHIPGAVLIPYDELETKFAEPDKGRPIVVYCRSGRRSAIAKNHLEEMGYANVSDFGGVSNWTGKLVAR